MENETELTQSHVHGAMSPRPTDRVQKGEISAKTTYQKSAKGPVSITECSNDGKYVALENTGRRDEFIGKWMIKRTVDGQDKIHHVLDPNFIMRSGSKIKIWTRGAKPASAPDTDMECSEHSWGIGSEVITKLLNPAGEDRASHIQRTIYSS